LPNGVHVGLHDGRIQQSEETKRTLGSDVLPLRWRPLRMSARKKVLLCVAVALIAIVVIASYTCGYMASAQLEEWETQASLGDTKAMMELFFYYDENEQHAEAEAWVKRAAAKGDPQAAMFLYSEYIVNEDPAQKKLAMAYLIKAAEHGSPSAQEILSHAYKEGSAALPKDPRRAQYWLRRSAFSGDADGVIELCNVAVAERHAMHGVPQPDRTRNEEREAGVLPRKPTRSDA